MKYFFSATVRALLVYTFVPLKNDFLSFGIFSNFTFYSGLQSKRLPYKDSKSTSLRLSGFSHSSWIREMQQASDKSIIISEILDSRTRNLVSVSRISDYVLSNELVSMALAMVAEDKQINRVLEELFAEEVRTSHNSLYKVEGSTIFQ